MAEQNQLFIYTLLLAMVITGTMNTVLYKYQNTTDINGVRFNHPYMQAFAMFVGEALCIFLYFYKVHFHQVKIQDTENSSESRLSGNEEVAKLPQNQAILPLLLPATFDCITSSLQHIALNFIPSSIYSMIRGGVIIITAFYSNIFLGRVLERFQIIGMAFTFSGVAIVGLSNFIFASSTSNEYSIGIQLVSIVLMIISLFFQAGIYVTEEKILKKYEIDTFFLVGVEGTWGIILFIVLLPILNFCPCSFNNGCVVHKGKNYMERTDEYFIQSTSDLWLGLAVIGGVLSISIYNLVGVNVTKYLSGIARTMIDVVRTVIIWIIGLMVTEWSDRKWENTSWKANLLEFFGYCFLVFGNLVYNKIIVIKQFNGENYYRQVKSDSTH